MRTYVSLVVLLSVVTHLFFPVTLHADGPFRRSVGWWRILRELELPFKEPLGLVQALFAPNRDGDGQVGGGEFQASALPLELTAEVAVAAPNPSQRAPAGPEPTQEPLVWRWPTTSRLISDAFGVPRRRGYHTGIDIVDRWKAPVYAAAPGVVVFAGDEGPTYGLSVVIRHSNGWLSRYAHLSGVYPRTGDRVAGGQLIGQIGDSGYAFGTHLHFEIIASGRYLDPLLVLQGR